MTSTPVEVLKVFAFQKEGAGGNPAGVVIDSPDFTEAEMQAIASKAQFSETVFVSKVGKDQFRCQFFTPTARVPDCGHATVAAFATLKHKYPHLTQVTKEIENGSRKIFLSDDKVFMEQPLARVESVLDAAVIQFLFKSPREILAGWHARHDVGFLLVEVRDEKALSELVPDFDQVTAYSRQHNLIGVYVFVRKSFDQRLIATTRMFAPAYGILEESATGMAAGLLASLLRADFKKEEFDIEQGRFMNPPSVSLITCRFPQVGASLLVGGSARLAETLNF